jgi:hypothetical protein
MNDSGRKQFRLKLVSEELDFLHKQLDEMLDEGRTEGVPKEMQGVMSRVSETLEEARYAVRFAEGKYAELEAERRHPPETGT